MKYSLLMMLPVLTLAGCNEINHTKLGYQVKQCIGDTTITCNDQRIKFAIAQTKLHRQSLLDNKDKALAEIGQTNYERMLALLDQKIAHLKGQRHNIYLRWFQGDAQDYREIDQGLDINADIQALGDKISQGMDAASQTSAHAASNQQQDVASLMAADVQTADAFNAGNSASQQSQQAITPSHQVTVLHAMELGEESVSLATDKGKIIFYGEDLTPEHIALLDSLSAGDCLIIHTEQTWFKNEYGLVEMPAFKLSAGDACHGTTQQAKHTSVTASKVCASPQATVFSCSTTKGKQIDVCEVGNQLSYRFGRQGQAAELSFSLAKTQAYKYLWSGMTTSEWNSLYLPRGNTIYQPYYTQNRDGAGAGYGLKVLVNQKEVADITCRNDTVIDNIEQVNVRTISDDERVF